MEARSVIALDVVQGSPEWLTARRGIPTSSQMHRIISPAKLKPSEQSFTYLCELVVERLLNVDVGPDSTLFMQRGSALEKQGIAFYEWHRDVTTTAVGLCLRDDRLIGSSPDRLVGDDGLLELKCPSATVHVGHLLEGLGNKYRIQVQSALWITGRKWADLLSFNPDLPPALIRAFPDKAVFDALDAAMPAFLEELDRCTVKLGGEARGDLSGLLVKSIDIARQKRAEKETQEA